MRTQMSGDIYSNILVRIQSDGQCHCTQTRKQFILAEAQSSQRQYRFNTMYSVPFAGAAWRQAEKDSVFSGAVFRNDPLDATQTR